MIAPDDFQKISEVFAEARALEGPERLDFLDRACEGIPELRRAVEELLSCDLGDSVIPPSVASDSPLADRTGAAHDFVGQQIDLDDGYISHAPVGRYRANAFGLHDIIGNVLEWCADGFYDYSEAPPRDGDGLRKGEPESRFRVKRGGCFYWLSDTARSSARWRIGTEFRAAYVGVRPARSLEVIE